MPSLNEVVKVKFYGGAEEVGNVRITVEQGGKILCLDYGIKQESEDDAQSFPKADFIVVSHGHLDHVGNTAYATILNKDTKFIGTETTKRLTSYQLNDILKIEERRKRENPQAKLSGRPFTLEDILKVENNWMPVKYGEQVDLGAFKVKLYNAGHIPGSSIIEVKTADKRIVYTGDINLEGNLNKEFPDMDKIEKNPDTLIIESTYGNQIRDSMDTEEKKFIGYVRDALAAGKNLFIPAFAIERMQRIGYLLNQIQPSFPDYNFYMVSPSFLKIKDIAYDKLDLSNLIESARLPNGYKGERSVVVSTSGFCNGGLSKKILREIIDNKHYEVIVPSGFLPNSSPIKEALDTGYIEFIENGIKSKKKVRAKIKQVKLSAHSDLNGLIKIVETICPDKTSEVYLVHGEPASQSHLKIKLEGLGYKVNIPKRYDEIAYD
jgi:putative mRNA 3-end processing factor